MYKEEIMVMIKCFTYNHENFIRQALEGFVMQKTTFPFIAVVVDDASTDNTAKIIREYEVKYPDIIKPYYLKENHYSKRKPKFPYFQDLTDKSKYIALCEGDDYWTDPYKLQKQVDFLEANEEYSMCFHRVSIINQETGMQIPESDFNITYHDVTSEEMLKATRYMHTATLLFRNVNLNNLLTYKSVANGDTALISLLGTFGSSAFIGDIEPSIYRVHNNGVWAKKNSLYKVLNHKKTYLALAKMHDDLKNNSISRHFIDRIDDDTNHKIFYHSIVESNLKIALKYLVINGFYYSKRLMFKNVFIDIKSFVKILIKN